MKNISVLIPALNEEATVGNIVKSLINHPSVDEVIVVNNGSTDKTADVALEAGAKVISEPARGFGRALKTGIANTSNNWIFKLDADFVNPSHAWIDVLVDAVDEKTKLVKAYWENNLDPMPVTKLLAKPFINTYVKNLSFINLPIAGIYLFDKTVINTSILNDDFTFDMQLMISIAKMNYGIKQCYLGEAYDTLKPLNNYVNMAEQFLSYFSSVLAFDYNALVILVAHSDDAEIWCGGTILRHIKNNTKVEVIVAVSDEVRNNECRRIEQQYQNIHYTFLNNDYFDIKLNDANISIIENILANNKNCIFISHPEFDEHPDHSMCYKLATASLIRINRELLPSKFLVCNGYFCNISSGSFIPDTFIDITEFADEKYKLINNFTSQDIEFWKRLAQSTDNLIGIKSQVKVAEGYMSIPYYCTFRAKNNF